MLLAAIADFVPACLGANPDVMDDLETTAFSLGQQSGWNELLDESLWPGTREPQILQNQVSHSEFGLVHFVMFSLPPVQWKSSFGTTITAMPLLPVDLRQIEQWQT